LSDLYMLFQTSLIAFSPIHVNQTDHEKFISLFLYNY
jgi:hypothetical protein